MFIIHKRKDSQIPQTDINQDKAIDTINAVIGILYNDCKYPTKYRIITDDKNIEYWKLSEIELLNISNEIDNEFIHDAFLADFKQVYTDFNRIELVIEYF